MISILVSEKRKKDADFLSAEVRDVIAKTWDEDVNILHTRTLEELNECMDASVKLDAAIVDVTSKDGVSVAKELRKKHPDIEILIVSDVTVSPITYLNPEIRAASLLLMPFKKKETEETLREFFGLLVHEESDEEGYFFMEIKGAKRRFPYNEICYFEARDKRVYVRVANVEYPHYDTMDHLEKMLSDDFVRCHRSYIVNKKYIEVVRYSQNYILLRGDYMVPLARSCKAAVKEVMSRG